MSSKAEPYVLRREKKQEDLPPKHHEDHWVELTEERREEYDAIYEERRRRIRQLADEGRNPRETKTSILGPYRNSNRHVILTNNNSPAIKLKPDPDLR